MNLSSRSILVRICTVFFLIIGIFFLKSYTQTAQAISLTQPPVIQYINQSTVHILWSTDVASDSRLYYGTNTSNFTNTAPSCLSGTSGVTHCAEIQNLLPATSYYFKIVTNTPTASGVTEIILGGNYFQTPALTTITESALPPPPTNTTTATPPPPTTQPVAPPATTTPTPLPPTSATEPPTTILVPQNNRILSNTVEIGIERDGALGIMLLLEDQLLHKTIQLGPAIQSQLNTNHWMYILDTRRFPNGPYLIIPQVKTSYRVYEAQPLTISIENVVSALPYPKNTPTSSLPTTTLLNPPLSPSKPPAIEPPHATPNIPIKNQEPVHVAPQNNTVPSKLPPPKIQTPSLEPLPIHTAERPEPFDGALLKNRPPTPELQDTDQDGIADYDEVHIFGTNPTLQDSNRDGILDGTSILEGKDPVATSSAVTSVAFENPKVTNTATTSVLAVEAITISKTTKTPDNQEIAKEITFKGKAFPNSYITLYIFSDPIVVTVKTDTDGNWNYTFDKELENGTHEMYVAVTDGRGKILTKSNPVPFVKQANAIELGSLVAPKAEEAPSFFNTNLFYISLVAIVLVIVAGFFVLGKNKHSGDDNSPGGDAIVWH